MKVCVSILLSGLLLACSSQPIETHQYLLRPQATTAQSLAQPTIGMGTVDIAPYLDHKGIALEVAPGEIKTANHHRWAESLDFAIRRYLQVAISNASGQNIAGSTRSLDGNETREINVLVYQLHSSASGSVKLVAEWQIRDLKSGSVEVRRNFSSAETLQGDGYGEVVRAHQALLDALARAITAGIDSEPGL